VSLFDVLAVVVAGFAAGLVNTVVGSGSLITYPVMVLLGVPPITANIANTVGLVPGSIAGAWGYRHQLKGARPLLLRLGATSIVGAVIGAALLTQLPNGAFKFVVPVLILAAAALVGLQPRILARSGGITGTRWLPLVVSVFFASVYGGYFSAAQGVILLGVLGLFWASNLQEQNAVKNVLQTLVNIVAALFFVSIGGVAWGFAASVAVGSVIGAPVGAKLAQRIPVGPFRVGIVIFGILMSIVTTILAFD